MNFEKKTQKLRLSLKELLKMSSLQMKTLKLIEFENEYFKKYY